MLARWQGAPHSVTGGDCKVSERVNRGPWGRTRQPMQGLQDPRHINLGDGEERVRMDSLDALL